MTRGVKKLIKGREQSHILTAQHVHHPIGIVHQALLGAQVGVGIAKAVLHECVIEPAHTVKSHARAQVGRTVEPWRVFVELDFLLGIALGVHVGDVVRHRAQGALIGIDGGTGNGNEITHGSCPALAVASHQLVEVDGQIRFGLGQGKACGLLYIQWQTF